MAVPEMPITIRASHDGGSAQDFVSRVVIHDEEFPVSDTSAESVANYFASPAQPYQAHYVVDANSTEHCVPEHRTAAHAPPNQGSIGIEQDGYARFSLAEWQTPGSQGTIARCAALTREICDRWGIPLVWLTPADLSAGLRGITSHANVTAAFHQSTHTDPGPSYPIEQFMALVLGAPTPGDDPVTEADFSRIQGMLNVAVDNLAATVTADSTVVQERLDAIEAKLDAAAP